MRQLTLFLEQNGVHVAALQETWLGSGDEPPPIAGYNWETRCRPHSSHGGVAFLIRTYVQYVREECQHDHYSRCKLEMLEITVRHKRKRLRVINAYCPPPCGRARRNTAQMLTELGEHLDERVGIAPLLQPQTKQQDAHRDIIDATCYARTQQTCSQSPRVSLFVISVLF